jgi:hypothetical protein
MRVFDGQQDRLVERGKQIEHLDTDPERRLAVACIEAWAQPPEQVLHTGVRDLDFRLYARGGQHPHRARPGARPDLAQQRRFTDAGLAADDERATPVVGRLVQQSCHGLDLGTPADNHRKPSPRAQPATRIPPA